MKKKLASGMYMKNGNGKKHMNKSNKNSGNELEIKDL